MIGMKLCNKCGYRHNRGRCCIDIYQQLGKTKGPSVAGKVLLAFVVPLLVFIASLILAAYILSIFVAEEGTNSFYALLIALAVTVVIVRIIRICTRKPVTTDKEMNKSV
jgi:hypothetical protein